MSLAQFISPCFRPGNFFFSDSKGYFSRFGLEGKKGEQSERNTVYPKRRGLRARTVCEANEPIAHDYARERELHNHIVNYLSMGRPQNFQFTPFSSLLANYAALVHSGVKMHEFFSAPARDALMPFERVR